MECLLRLSYIFILVSDDGLKRQTIKNSSLETTIQISKQKKLEYASNDLLLISNKYLFKK